MKNVFEFQRFRRVLKYTWATQPVLPYIVLLAGIPLFVVYLLRVAAKDGVSIFSTEPFLMFLVYFFGCCWLYAGLMFREFASFNTSYRYVLLPGSGLEKWLAKVILVGFVFPVFAWLCYLAGVQLLNLLSVRLFAFRFQPIDWGSMQVQAALLFFYLSLPVALASGAIWKSNGLLKGLLGVFVLLLLLYFLIDASTPPNAYKEPVGILFHQLSLPIGDSTCQGSTCLLNQLFWFFGAYLPALLLLTSTYFFTAKKEV